MPTAAAGRAVKRLTLRSDARELRALRQNLRDFLLAHDVNDGPCDDVILVANELTTNAIEAAALGSDVRVEIAVTRNQVVLTIENVGPRFELPDHVALPGPTSRRGRGLALTHQIVDELRAEPLVDGTRVVAHCTRMAQPR